MVIPVAVAVAAFKAFCWFCGAVGTCYCAKKAHDAYQKHHNTEQRKLEYSLEEKKLAKERNDKLQEEKNNSKSELEEKIEQREKKQKDLENAKNKANDSNLSDEERRKWRLKVVGLEDELRQDDKGIRKLTNRIKEIEEQMKANDKIINSTDLVGGKNKSWIWEFLTLENILIMLAVYALYNIVRDERRH